MKQSNLLLSSKKQGGNTNDPVGKQKTISPEFQNKATPKKYSSRSRRFAFSKSAHAHTLFSAVDGNQVAGSQAAEYGAVYWVRVFYPVFFIFTQACHVFCLTLKNDSFENDKNRKVTVVKKLLQFVSHRYKM